MAGKGSSRTRRAITSSLVLVVFAAILAASNAYTHNRDVATAVGPPGPGQQDFFDSAASRPDITAFFKNLTPAQKLQVARNLGNYDDPKMAALASIWLTDFDAPARIQLTADLKKLASSQPDSVIGELKNGGGFQKLAVFDALRSRGVAIYPLLASALEKPELRGNASELMISIGKPAATVTSAKLESADKDVRLAAADTLGKMGAVGVGPMILRLYDSAQEPEKSSYLASLANLGWPGAEPSLTKVIEDAKSTPPDRSAAIMGLGRIASPTAIRKLWSLTSTDNRDAVASLILCGDAGLEGAKPSKNALTVASGIHSQNSDRLIANCLTIPNLANQASEAAKGRPSIVPQLKSALSKLNPSKDGDKIMDLVDALNSTDEGRKTLDALEYNAGLKGFILRSRALSRN